MKTYQMPCLRRAASQSRLSTSLTMMKDPTQVSWTAGTAPGMRVASVHVICPCSHFSGSVCSWCKWVVLLKTSSWTSFCLIVCRDGSRAGLVSWPLAVFQPDFRQLFSDASWSDTDYLDLSVTGIAEGSTKALLSGFLPSLSGYTSNSLIHTFTDHCTFTLLQPHFLSIWAVGGGLNMAVITGCYESHVSGALLPNVNDCRHRNFHDYHKKTISGGQKRYECAHMFATTHPPVCVAANMCVYMHHVLCTSAIHRGKLVIGGTWYLCSTGKLLHKYSTNCLPVCAHVCLVGCIVQRSSQTPTWCSWSPMPRRRVCRVTPDHYDRPNNPVSFHSTRKNQP